MGAFPISFLDALRLRRGLAELTASDPPRAARVRERARAALAVLAQDYPGDAATGEIDEERLEQMADDDPCPALDPASGLCDLYGARPLTCRAFGPPVRGAGGAIGVCELCFQGAPEEEIAACAVDLDADGLEAEALRDMEAPPAAGQTLVAFALAPRRAPPTALR